MLFRSVYHPKWDERPLLLAIRKEGAPFIETTHNDLKFTAPLSAITAAVVGVILNLALFFGYHVLWPQGFSGKFELASALIAVAAAIALFRFKRGVIEVIGASAVIGLLLRLASL